MAIKISLLTSLLLLVFNYALPFSSMASVENRKPYIVYMGSRPEGEERLAASRHLSLLQKSIGSTFSSDYLLYSYKRSFDGFVAYLSEDEAQMISELPDVVSVFPDEELELETTGSWDFLGLPEEVDRSNLESDIIVGVIDSGISPESQSFDDTGYGSPPSKWKGSCQVTPDDLNFTCNNKIIGARFYRSSGVFGSSDVRSPRDTNGHGTHVASIVAGGLVRDASFYGLADGTARGGVPSARIAAYKVCWSSSCASSDILAAFDDAVADGVDIISVSIASTALNYFGDSISIGSFGAMRNGILTSTSAGNTGPNARTIRKFAPWFLSVAASTTNRKFVTEVVLGDGRILEGISINRFDLGNDQYPIIYAGYAPNETAGFNGQTSRLCGQAYSLDANLVRGNIVLCDARITGPAPSLAGAVGVVVANDTQLDYPAEYLPYPVSQFSVEAGLQILEYIRSTGNPTATIHKSVETYDIWAPYVASFSARGPNILTPDILKPDISAPGVSILGAWSGSVPYHLASGTSAAAPHATGAAAYVKTFHPTWSPAAIRSALMTTASPISRSGWKNTVPEEFASGAGNINPIGAKDPGLVYDADANDYASFLCGQGYDTPTLRLITGDDTTCTAANNRTVWELNHPSFAASVPSGQPFSRFFLRAVTNVGSAYSTYTAVITAPPTLGIHVIPPTLSFTSLGQTLQFVLILRGELDIGSSGSATLVWDDGEHKVRSPIIAYSAAASDFVANYAQPEAAAAGVSTI
ncbi:hypothetical protein Tsubulata_003408 [Turnera subulata]|uniref:Cucumisin-like n=1 Tax=Turnera subulata TaxID=218843 RepID=A0A9Q0J7H3_9ROSI|nr:hypothetical protein Tsubulata_003408 [Turnera subulata]